MVNKNSVRTGNFIKVLQFLQAFLLPLLFGSYPSVLLYTNNISKVLLSSLERILLLYFIITLIIYLTLLIFAHFNPYYAALSSCLIIIVFNTYGVIYQFLFTTDFVRVEHYTLIPVSIVLIGYLCWLLKKLSVSLQHSIWKFSTILFIGFYIISLVQIIPQEIKKSRNLSVQTTEITSNNSTANNLHPDIYYLVFDEFSGLETMREYWKNSNVDKFKDLLESKGFFVAEESQASSIDTLQQMASRLNYQDYSTVDDQDMLFQAIINNKVMNFLKTKGYTTVVFQELSFAYPTFPQFKADYVFSDDTIENSNTETLFDEFGMLVLDKTIVSIFSSYYKVDNVTYANHINMLQFTGNKLGNLSGIATPKFIYSHLLLPHFPFIFDSNGILNSPQNYYNWNYYEGNYNYTLGYISNVISEILKNSDPENPPVIIIQSDHGARNIAAGSPGSVTLPDFSDELKRNILFAIYLPGFDKKTLPQNINPINTFPIVFNNYFNADIQLK
jgi:hypothetical protein